MINSTGKLVLAAGYGVGGKFEMAGSGLAGSGWIPLDPGGSGGSAGSRWIPLDPLDPGGSRWIPLFSEKNIVLEFSRFLNVLRNSQYFSKILNVGS